MVYQYAAYAMAATCAGSWASRDGCAESHPMVLPTCLLSKSIQHLSMVKGCDYVIRVQHGMTTFQPQRSVDVAFDPRAR